MAAQICEICKHKGSGCYCSPNSTCDKYETNWNEYLYDRSSANTITIASRPKIVNGSTLTIGEKIRCITIYHVDQHFNWFQKLMWKWAFGIKVEDYSEE